MHQRQQVKIKIIKVILDAKFPCTMHFERQGATIAQSTKHENGIFVFDTHPLIMAYKNSIVQWDVKLKTSKGATYNCGKIILHTDTGEQKCKTIISSIQNCYDKFAKAEFFIEIDATANNSLASFSQSKFKTLSLNYPSQPLIHAKLSSILNSNRDNNSMSSVSQKYGKASDGMYSIFYKQREKVNKIVSPKPNNSKLLYESDAARYADTKQLSELQKENEDKQNLIQSLQLQVVRLETALEASNKRNQQQKRMQIDMSYLHQEQIQYLKDQYMKTTQLKCNEFNEQIKKLKSQVLHQQQIVNQTNAKLNQYKQLLQSKQQRVKQLQKERMDKQNLNEALNQTIKIEKIKHESILCEKQQLLRKQRQKEKQKQQHLQINKKYKLAIEQLGMLKKSLKETIEGKDNIIERLSQQSKKNIQMLNSSLYTLTHELKQARFNCVTSQNNIVELQSIVIKLQEKNSLYKQKINILNENYERSKLSEESYNKQNQLLQQSQKQLTQKVQYLETELKTLQSEKQKQALECQQKQKKINNLNQRINTMSYKMEQTEMRSAINVQQNDFSHMGCRAKVESLIAQLQIQRMKNSKLMLDIIQHKNNHEQSERLLHQLRLEQSRLRQQWQNKSQKLSEADRKILLFQKQLKTKQACNESFVQQIAKLTQINKQNDKKIIKLSLQNFELQQKTVKIITQGEINFVKINQLEVQICSKMTQIQKLQQRQFELRNKLGKEKQERTKTQNELRISKRQLQRYISQIKTEISMYVKVDNEKPIQSLVSYYKNAMMKMETQVSQMVGQLKQIKDEIDLKNKTLEQLHNQLEIRQKEAQQNQSTIDELQYELQNKESQYQIMKQQYQDLLSVHQQYIFTFNRYKIDKQAQISSRQQQFDQKQTKLKLQLKTKNNQLENTHELIQKNGKYKQNVVELQNKLRLLQKEGQKQKIIIDQLQSEIDSQKIKSFKLLSQLNLKNQQNNKLVMQSQLLRNNNADLSKQLQQKHQLLVQTNKIKDKKNTDSLKKDEQISNLSYEKHMLAIKNQQYKHQCQELVDQIEQLNKLVSQNTRREKELQQQLNQVMKIRKQVIIKLKQKQQQVKQLNQCLEQQRIKHQKDRLNLTDICKELQQKDTYHINLIKKLETNIQNLNEEIIKQRMQNQNLQIKMRQFQDLHRRHNIVTSKIEIEQQKIKQLNEELTLQNHMLQKVSLQNLQLKSQLSQKEQLLFSVSGKANSIQMNWQAEQKRLRNRQIELNQILNLRLQQYKNTYQQKIEKCLQIIAHKQIDQKKQSQIVKLAQQEIVKLKNDLREANFFCEQRSKINEQQLEYFKYNMQQKLIKSQTTLKHNYQKQREKYEMKKEQYETKIEELKDLVNKESQQNKKLMNQIQLYKSKIMDIQPITKEIQEKIITNKHTSPKIKNNHNFV